MCQTTVQDIFASRDDAGIPGVLIGWRNLDLEGHGVDRVDVVVGVTLGKNRDIIAALNDLRTEDLGCFDERDTVVIDTELSEVVARSHVARNADEAGTKGGGPCVVWQI